MPSTRKPPTTLVWAWPVRIAHGAVAGIVVFNLFFSEAGSKVHRYAGYAAVGFVVLRTVYGLTQRGRPAGLHWPAPSACLRHARAMLSGHPPRVEGHNPLGMAMALLLWATVLLLGLTGWISQTDAFWGLAWPMTIHEALTVVLQVAIVLHLLGVAVSSLLERQNLAAAMLTGRKKPPSAGGRA